MRQRCRRVLGRRSARSLARHARCSRRASTARSAPASCPCRRCARRAACWSTSFRPRSAQRGSRPRISSSTTRRRSARRGPPWRRPHRDGPRPRPARHLDPVQPQRARARGGQSLELADPFGLVRTCSVATADRRLRIVLNVSRSPLTRTARTVAALGGKPAVHHIAFACADIFQAVEALRAPRRRVRRDLGQLLRRSAGALRARPGAGRAHAPLGILYDRDGAGEYFHIYSESFAGRFFFEIVHRSNYDGLRRAQRPCADGLAGAGERTRLSPGELS